MFPQFGAPIGFVCSNGVFLVLTALLDDQQFLAWGWRIPFIASAVLVLVGLWVRLRLAETPDFERTLARNERVQIPIIDVFRRFPRELVLGLLAATSAFLLFYILTVFALSWGTSKLGYSRHSSAPGTPQGSPRPWFSGWSRWVSSMDHSAARWAACFRRRSATPARRSHLTAPAFLVPPSLPMPRPGSLRTMASGPWAPTWP